MRFRIDAPSCKELLSSNCENLTLEETLAKLFEIPSDIHTKLGFNPSIYVGMSFQQDDNTPFVGEFVYFDPLRCKFTPMIGEENTWSHTWCKIFNEELAKL